ncbi:MAG: pirin family protein [Beijerinckiaceae bacterium]
MSRKIVEGVFSAFRDDIGELVTRRPLPGPSLPDLDPFLFLNHHGPQTYRPGNRGLPFGPHPHRGFETVTFILEGSLAHHDSGGSSSIIEAGGVQWMTAGRGLVHAEISPPAFLERGGPLEILQLWVNLPARLKMVEPEYVGVQAPDIPSVSENGATVRLISGAWKGATGPVTSKTGVFMSVVDLAPGGLLHLEGLNGRTMFIYIVSGTLEVEGVDAPAWTIVRCSHAGGALDLGSREGARILLGHAEPIREPIVAHGPFVMNSVEEIEQAIADYRAGLFGGLPA